MAALGPMLQRKREALEKSRLLLDLFVMPKADLLPNVLLTVLQVYAMARAARVPEPLEPYGGGWGSILPHPLTHQNAWVSGHGRGAGGGG